jgi:hypothetical protein
MREKERLIESALAKSFFMERDRHHDIKISERSDVSSHPFAERLPQRAARPVFEEMDRLPQRPLERADGQGLVELRGIQPARAAFMCRRVGKRIR